ncbi:chromatin assembly factor 1 subunit A-like [Gigantopelta aegis]|uniref:chromatin assembly factor 1 subunit A-like n=1 Tax=Gigantopelta aegis TaxID=1735272 RepID=UPI001B888584|nr:chromatin assembly factor 1 subunit A-like [Gigantopelta aegis]
MAKTADRIKSNILEKDPIILIEKDELPPTKKLKQARLPFHPVDSKVQMSKNLSPQASKKRKLSDPESPSAKTPKIINKSLIDKPKHDKHTTDKVANKSLLEKGKRDTVNSDKHHYILIDDKNDNEVSSSSEADNQPLLIANKRRASETNLLERFVKKSPQEEISSTNEVIDCTDSDEDRVVVVSSTKETSSTGDLLILDKPVDSDKIDKVVKLNSVIKIPHLKESGDKSELSECVEDPGLHLEKIGGSGASTAVPAQSGNVQTDESVSDQSSKKLVKSCTKDITEETSTVTATVVNTDIETGKTEQPCKDPVTPCTRYVTEETNSITAAVVSAGIEGDKTEQPYKDHVTPCSDVVTKPVSTVTILNANDKTCKSDLSCKKSVTPCSGLATEQLSTLGTAVSATVNTGIKNCESRQSCKSLVKPCTDLAESLSTVTTAVSVSSDTAIKICETEQPCKKLVSNDTTCSDVNTEQICGVEMASSESVSTVVETTIDKNCQNSTEKTKEPKIPDCVPSTSADQNVSCVETHDDIICMKDDKEDDQSDVDCPDESLLDSSGCTSAKSDESFSETTLSTSTTSIKQSPKLVTSTPKNKPRSRKISDFRKQEREAARLEKLQKREKERLEKIKMKEAEKAQKEEEKMKKNKERLEKKAQMEQERLEKIQQKEEEKKKKQEMLDAKVEEKRKKEEEKRLKDEERQKEEEEKIKKKQKAQQAFSSFFFIKQKAVTSKPKEVISSFFMPFEVKTDMILAPVQRRKIGEEERVHLDDCLQSQNDDKLYISDIKEKGYKRGSDSRTELPSQPSSADLDVIEVSSDVKKVTYPAKFLSFHTNYRPPYFGTWRKKSKVLTARNPFKKDDKIFDYEVDSDDEWEEEEPGESLENSEGEEEKEGEEDEEEEEDGWMVPHGYLSEDEICEEDEEVTPEVLKARQMAKAEAWEAEMKRQCQPVLPLVIGCFWEGETPVEEKMQKLQTFKAVCMVAVVPVSLVNDEVSLGRDSEGGTLNRSGLKKPVPEEAIPYLIQLVHGNTLGIKKLVKEFRWFWKQKNNPKPVSDEIPMEIDDHDSPNKSTTFDLSLTEDKNKDETDLNETQETNSVFAISKRQVEMKIASIATRERRQDRKICWFVHDSVLEQYGCQGISLPNNWQYVSNVKKQLKTNDENSGRKTPKNVPETTSKPPKNVPETTSKMECDENLESGQMLDKPVSKDQRSIMDFAKKNTPIIFKEIEKPTLAPLTSVKGVRTDQRSITNFTKKCANDETNPLCITITDSPTKDSAPASFVSPRPRPNTIVGMLKPVMSHVGTTKQKTMVSPVQMTRTVPDSVIKPTIVGSTRQPEIMSPVQMTRKVPDSVKRLPTVPVGMLKPVKSFVGSARQPAITSPVQLVRNVPDSVEKPLVPPEVFRPIVSENISVPAVQEGRNCKLAEANVKDNDECILIE